MQSTPTRPGNMEHLLMGEREQALYLAISMLKSPEEIRDFLRDVFTVEEIEHAAKRWCVVRGLLDGATHEVVRQDCTTSKATVSRANKTIVKFGTGISQTLYERLHEQPE
jgi:TrpR-related protein YerC/YecD